MSNPNPYSPKFALLKIGDTYINPAHIAAIGPAPPGDPSSPAPKSLRIELAGGKAVYVHDDEVDALKFYLRWRATYDHDSFVDVMWCWEEAKKEETKRGVPVQEAK